MRNPFKRKPKRTELTEEDFEVLWNERLCELERLYGKSDDIVGHGIIPFLLGPENGGTADLVYFSTHIDGKLTVTSELIGLADQKFNSLGNYELAIAHRDPEEKWGPGVISRLGHYTLEKKLEPNETMDIAPITPEGSTIDALLFLDYGSFLFRSKPAGIILCLGITKSEKEACFDGKHKELIRRLKNKDVFPFTDLYRESVI